MSDIVPIFCYLCGFYLDIRIFLEYGHESFPFKLENVALRFCYEGIFPVSLENGIAFPEHCPILEDSTCGLIKHKSVHYETDFVRTRALFQNDGIFFETHAFQELKEGMVEGMGPILEKLYLTDGFFKEKHGQLQLQSVGQYL